MQLFVRICDEPMCKVVSAESNWLLATFSGSLPCPNILPVFYSDVNICLLLTEGCYKATLIH